MSSGASEIGPKTSEIGPGAPEFSSWTPASSPRTLEFSSGAPEFCPSSEGPISRRGWFKDGGLAKGFSRNNSVGREGIAKQIEPARPIQLNLKTAVGAGMRQTLRWSPKLGRCCRPRALTRRQGCRTPSISGAEWQRHPAAGRDPVRAETALPHFRRVRAPGLQPWPAHSNLTRRVRSRMDPTVPLCLDGTAFPCLEALFNCRF